MKRFILYILVFALPALLYGQMLPLSDFYLYNGHAINPAFVGSQEALSATILYRNQWVGFEDAPKNQFLSVHTPLSNDRIGLGIVIDNQSIGIFNKTTILGNYAYRIELGKGILAMGLGFGVSAYKNAWNELAAVDENDEKLMNNSSSAFLPAFSLGTYYYTPKYFIGISLPFFLNDNMDQFTGKFKVRTNFSEYNYFATGGYRFVLSPGVKLLPYLMVRYLPKSELQVDYNLRLNLKDRIWMGAAYRSGGMLIGLFQCQITYQLRMAYSYNFFVSGTGDYMNGTHEVLLNYVFRYSRNVNGPRKF